MWAFVTGVIFTLCVCALTWFLGSRVSRRTGRDDIPLCLVFVVNHAEQEIEGLLRMVLWASAGTKRDRRLVVIDTGASDETKEIVARVDRGTKGVEYRRVPSEADIGGELTDLCLRSFASTTVYDLRTGHSMSALHQDIQRVCQ